MWGIVENKEHWLPGGFMKVSCQVLGSIVERKSVEV